MNEYLELGTALALFAMSGFFSFILGLVLGLSVQRSRR